MALTLEEAARNAACNAVVDLLDGGDIQIGTSGFGLVLATLDLGTPAFGDAASGEADANAIADDENTVEGTAAAFRARTSAPATLFSGTVGTSGADINFNAVAFTNGGKASLTSFKVTMPGS